MSMWKVCQCEVKPTDSRIRNAGETSVPLYTYDDLGVSRIYIDDRMIEISKEAVMLMVGQYVHRELMNRVESLDQAQCVDILIDSMIAKRKRELC